jgi:hypothetical protein
VGIKLGRDVAGVGVNWHVGGEKCGEGGEADGTGEHEADAGDDRVSEVLRF